MNTESILGIGAIGITLLKTLYDVFRARFEGKKLNADAAQTLINSAVGLSNEMEQDLKEMRARVDTLESEHRAMKSLLHNFQNWAELAWAKLTEAQIEIRKPPHHDPDKR